MTPHPQADILRAIADGEEMEQKCSDGVWRGIKSDTLLRWIAVDTSFDYTPYFRIKRKTININGIEVPEPMREEPEFNTDYWVADPVETGGETACIWDNMEADKRWLSLGLCHLTQEAATIHAKALLSFTRRI